MLLVAVATYGELIQLRIVILLIFRFPKKMLLREFIELFCCFLGERALVLE